MVAGLILVSTVGCSRTVTMTDPSPSEAIRTQCAGLMGALPGTVLDEQRRTVEPGQLSAAWGDPTITLKCGVDKPPGLGAESECFEVNGVGWFAEEADGGYLFTTIGRPAYVQVGVPSDYAPEAHALVDVAEAVKKIPVEQPCV